MAELNGTNIQGNLTINGIDIFLLMYPVGSVYISTNSTNPSSLFGGTWIAWGSGKVPVGVNSSDSDFSSVEKTGGSKTVNLSHTHTGPSHTHTSAAHTHTANHNHSLSAAGWACIETTYQYLQYREVANKSFTPTWAIAGTGSAGLEPPAAATSGTELAGYTDTKTLTTGSTTPGNTGASGTGNTGSAGSSTQTIVQPYITCYMWKRTA